MASTRLTRTASGGSNQIYTASCWVKRTGLSASTTVLSTGDGSADNNARMLFIDASDKIEISYYNAGYTYEVTTNRVLRDTSAWYHLVVAVNTTEATASNRIKIWVNGVQETSFETSSYPSLNATFNYNSSAQYIGDLRGSGIYSDFVLSHLNYIDGTAYDASAFGETDTLTGIWKPKTAPSVTYGTNGFFLKFENSGSMGTDSSGNGNNFTVNGTLTQTIDTPSNVFATINTLVQRTSLIGSADQSYINGNLTSINNSSAGASGYNVSTLGMTSGGKYYAEVKIITLGSSSTSTFITGISKVVNTANFPMSTGLGYRATGEKYDGASSTAYGATLANGDIVGIAFDLDNGTLTFYKNGVSQGTAFTSIDASETWFISTTSYGDTSEAKFSYNFGNGYFGTTAVSSAQSPSDGIGIFEYTVPTGYKALCTKSINAQEYA